jgi:hypothetical protein
MEGSHFLTLFSGGWFLWGDSEDERSGTFGDFIELIILDGQSNI